MSARDGTDEVCANGVVILWSQRSEKTRQTPVSVRYPCCGAIVPVIMSDLDRYRKGRVSRCLACKQTPTPIQGKRPLCVQCGRRPVQQQYSKGVVTSYADRCWACRTTDLAKS